MQFPSKRNAFCITARKSSRVGNEADVMSRTRVARGKGRGSVCEKAPIFLWHKIFVEMRIAVKKLIGPSRGPACSVSRAATD